MADEQNPVEKTPGQTASANGTARTPAAQNGGAAPAGDPSAPAASAPETKPQVIVKQEYSAAHYIGIAFITVCAVLLYFMPGIAVVFGVSKVTELSAPAAWLFAAIFSVILWFLFWIKLRGFKRSLYLYLAFCTAVFIAFAVLQGTGKADIFHGVVRLLLGT